MDKLSRSLLEPGRYWALGAALFALLGLRATGADWIGDFWIYVATIAEVAADPWSPRNPLHGNDYAFAFFSPYTWGLGLLSRLTGLDPFRTLMLQAFVNLALFLGALYAFVTTVVGRRGAAFYALLAVLFLWGPDPWRFSSFFHLRSLAYVVPYPSTFGASVALVTLAAFPRLSRDGSLRWALLAAPVLTLLFIAHPVNAVFLCVGLVILSAGGPRAWRHWSALAVVPAVSLLLALAWPLFPVADLLFQQTALVHEGNTEMYNEPLRRVAPALLGLPWLLVRLRRNRRDPLALLGFALLALYAFGGLAGQWTFGRLLSHAVLTLQLCVADALASFEEWLGRLRRGVWWRVALTAIVCGGTALASWSSTVAPTWRDAGAGDPAWLSFLRGRVGHYDVVLTDRETCWYVPSFSGKVVGYPMHLPFVPDQEQRLAAVERYLASATSREERLVILRRYHVRWLLLDKAHTPEWRERASELGPRAQAVFRNADYELLRLEVEPAGDAAAAPTAPPSPAPAASPRPAGRPRRCPRPSCARRPRAGRARRGGRGACGTPARRPRPG